MLIYKLSFIICFGFAYYQLYKKLYIIEEKILFGFFFTFYYIGGGIVSLIFDNLNNIFIDSYYKPIHTDVFLWLMFYLLVFGIPYLTMIISMKILRVNIEKVVAVDIKPKFYIVSLFIVILYIILNIDIIQSIVSYTFNTYSDSVLQRADIDYGIVFVFCSKVLLFVLFLAISFTFYFNKKKIKSFLIFSIGLIIYGIVEKFLFFSKLYLIGYVFSYLIFLFIYESKVKMFLISLPFTICYISFYISNIGSSYSANFLVPVLSGITRFTLSTPYYINYYTNNAFDKRVYFHSSLFGGDPIVSPNIRVFPTMYVLEDKFKEVASLASGVFVYNYANFFVFSILQSFIEIGILILLYKFIILTDKRTPVKIAIFFLIVFGILNYGFISILLNPYIGLGGFVFIYTIFNLYSNRKLFVRNNN